MGKFKSPMPHCIVEYSADLKAHVDIQQVLRQLFDLLEKSAEFDSAAIKLRAQPYSDVFSGLADHSFMHIRLHILSGRSPQQKLALTSAIVNGLSAQLAMVKSLSAEVVDIQRESYTKRLT